VTTGGLFCATARHPNWANAIRGGHGSDTFWPLPSPGSSQHPESLIINARDRLTRSAQDPVRILVTGPLAVPLLLKPRVPPRDDRPVHHLEPDHRHGHHSSLTQHQGSPEPAQPYPEDQSGHQVDNADPSAGPPTACRELSFSATDRPLPLDASDDAARHWLRYSQKMVHNVAHDDTRHLHRSDQPHPPPA
jgi:hypothetical protein